MTGGQFLDPLTRPGVERGLADGFYKPVGRAGNAAVVLIIIAAILNAVAAIWWDRTDLGLAATIGLVVAGMFFLMWLWQARQNAEILCAARHRRSRVWLTLGWLIPGLNLWFPYQIVDDIHRASRPGNPDSVTELRTVPGSWRLPTWWASWLVNNIAAAVLAVDSTLDDGTVAWLLRVGAVGLAGAAVLVIMIIREISAWQAPGRGPSA